MNKRRERIDYKKLHTSGLKVLKSSESNTSVNSSSDSLSVSSVGSVTDIQLNTETLKCSSYLILKQYRL